MRCHVISRWLKYNYSPQNHYISKKYDLLHLLRHLNPRRKGRRRRRCSVLVLSTSHCSTALPLCTARQLVYFVVHSMYCWRPLATSRFCNFSRKERKRKHVHLPTPLVSYIFLGLACLKQAGARLLCGCMEPLFSITWTWFWNYKHQARCGIFGVCLLSFPQNERKICKLRQISF